MLPIELSHYNVWADRLEAALEVAYPNTMWLVLQHDELDDGDPLSIGLPWDGGLLPAFRLMAVKVGTGRYLYQDVPYTLVVDEEAFALAVVALGRELERRLAAMVEEG
jgi:hypothetical protein